MLGQRGMPRAAGRVDQQATAINKQSSLGGKLAVCLTSPFLALVVCREAVLQADLAVTGLASKGVGAGQLFPAAFHWAPPLFVYSGIVGRVAVLRVVVT